MDSRISSDACESATRKKPRRLRSKVSAVNYRLDPNFDLRSLLKQSDKETKHNNVALNPKTMEFEMLISFLRPAVILEYLQKIQHFLTSSITKMSFQNIAIFKEILLVRLCQEKSNLNCAKFTEESKKVAHQIIEVLKANQNVYEWTCKYDKGILIPDVLVYEKVYTTDAGDNLRIAVSSSSNVTRSILPPINSNTRGDSRHVPVTPTNKVDLLNTLLKFIKDDTRLKLEYPHILKSQVALLSSLICQGKIVDADEGFGCKSLYAPLKTALDAYKQMYDFNVSFQEDSDVTIDRNTSNASDGSQNCDANKSSKQMINLMSIGAFEEKFIRASLREILYFMEDDSSASLCFTKVTEEKKKYLHRILDCFRDTKVFQQFTPECRVLLRKIEDAYKNANWSLVLEDGKRNRDTRLLDITMRKEPRYTKPTVLVTPQSLTAQTANPNPVSSPRRTKTPAKTKPISFQSAGAIDTSIDKGAAVTEQTVDPAKLVAHNARKSRLLADMSVPVECDKGERMMRLMGWRGGALGVRGEGITQPIIPPLHLALRAGLGHVKQVTTTSTLYEFRCQFLSSVLSFLRADESETTLQYTYALERKQERFVNRAIQNMKQGIGCGLSRVNEKRLLEEIFEEMGKRGSQVEGGVSGPDKKKISLKKAPLSARKTKVKKHKNIAGLSTNKSNNSDLTADTEPTPLNSQNTPIIHNTDSTNGNTTEIITENDISALREHFDLDNDVETSKAAKYLANKVMCLTKIQNFLQGDEEKRCYSFECVLNKKLKCFLSSVVIHINKKATLTCGSQIENAIYSDIKKATPQGCCLSVLFETKKLILEKKIYQKRFTNSARDLPPPKSTDLQNTIIYQNNKVISDGVTNNSDYDDVIIIEKEIDVIVISDDEDHEIENSKKIEDEEIDQKNEDSLISIDFSQDLSTSRETLLLEMLEEDFKVKTEDVESELDSEIRELEQAIIDCDIICDDKVVKPKQIFDVKQELDTLENNCKDLELEINNNSMIYENTPNFVVIDCMQQREEKSIIDEKHAKDKCLANLQTIENEKITETQDEDKGENLNSLQLTKEDNIKESLENLSHAVNQKKSSDDSQVSSQDNIESFAKKEKATDDTQNRLQIHKDCNENREVTTEKAANDFDFKEREDYLVEDFKDRIQGKRSRSASITSEPESSCKKCKNQIRSVHISCKDPDQVLNTDVIKKVHSVISKSIDNVDFLPRLECRGVKNGGLVYSCHDDKTFAWLTSLLLGCLDLNVIESNYPSETYKTEIRIHSFEDVHKILNRLKLYNPELDTSLWRVIEKKELKDFVIITVELDKDSYNYVNKNNYSLFAGVDKAKFNVVWR